MLQLRAAGPSVESTQQTVAAPLSPLNDWPAPQDGSRWQFPGIPVNSLEYLSQNKLPLADPHLNIRELGASCLALLLLPLLPQTSATSGLCQLHPNHRLPTTGALSQLIHRSVCFLLHTNQVSPEACWEISAFMFLSSLLFGDHLIMKIM